MCDYHSQIVVFFEDLRCVDGVFAGYSVVAEIPKYYGGENEEQGSKLTARQTSAAAVFLLGFVYSVLCADSLHVLNEFRLANLANKDNKGNEHDSTDDADVEGVVHELIFNFAGSDHHAEHEHRNTAKGAHEIDDGVTL